MCGVFCEEEKGRGASLSCGLGTPWDCVCAGRPYPHLERDVTVLQVQPLSPRSLSLAQGGAFSLLFLSISFRLLCVCVDDSLWIVAVIVHFKLSNQSAAPGDFVIIRTDMEFLADVWN